MPAKLNNKTDSFESDLSGGDLLPMDLLKALVVDEVKRCVQFFQKHYQVDMSMPELRFDIRGVCAGQAHADKHLLRFNPVMLEKHGQAFIKDTVPHEMAHLLVNKLWGRRAKPHGMEWRGVMQQLGASPQRCHTYEVQPSRRLKRYIYRCRCRMHRMTSIRHNRAKKGTRYHCTRCRGRLHFIKPYSSAEVTQAAVMS